MEHRQARRHFYCLYVKSVLRHDVSTQSAELLEEAIECLTYDRRRLRFNSRSRLHQRLFRTRRHGNLNEIYPRHL
jgi:hypothetical protein